MISSGISAPRPAGLVAEPGGGLVVVAESVRDDGCGHLQELLPDRGAAGGSGRDSDLAEKRGQVVGASFITLTTACAPALTTYGPHAPGEVKGAGVAVRPITGTPPGGNPDGGSPVR